jgi:hypothetical protein
VGGGVGWGTLEGAPAGRAWAGDNGAERQRGCKCASLEGWRTRDAGWRLSRRMASRLRGQRLEGQGCPAAHVVRPPYVPSHLCPRCLARAASYSLLFATILRLASFSSPTIPPQLWPSRSQRSSSIWVRCRRGGRRGGFMPVHVPQRPQRPAAKADTLNATKYMKERPRTPLPLVPE